MFCKFHLQEFQGLAPVDIQVHQAETYVYFHPDLVFVLKGMWGTHRFENVGCLQVGKVHLLLILSIEECLLQLLWDCSSINNILCIHRVL